MLKFEATHQEQYSRGELLLRTMFGIFYIGLPHLICMIPFAIWGMILRFITWWIILFTGKYPKDYFEYQVKLVRWSWRLTARLSNLVDGYPAFGLNGTDDRTVYEVEYREPYGQGQLLLITFFGQLMVLPHIFCLILMFIGAYFVVLIAFWVVLITGKYPMGMHNYMVGLNRWVARMGLYLQFMYPSYPPFSGKSDEDLKPTNPNILDAK